MLGASEAQDQLGELGRIDDVPGVMAKEKGGERCLQFDVWPAGEFLQKLAPCFRGSLSEIGLGKAQPSVVQEQLISITQRCQSAFLSKLSLLMSNCPSLQLF